RRMETPAEYRAWFKSRETIIYENENKTLPSAVIFRDSTLDFAHEYIAQHFSRVVFVWYLGQVVQPVLDRENPQIVLQIMAERFINHYPQHQPILSNIVTSSEKDVV